MSVAPVRLVTALTRACVGCKHFVYEGEIACTHCGRIPVPLVRDWPADLLEWIPERRARNSVSHLVHHTEQEKWQFLLETTYAAGTYDGIILPHFASAADCLPIALRECVEWVKAGKPRFL